MQNCKRNSVVLVTYNNTQRLALVKSVRPSTGKVNVTMYLYANASIATDYLVDPTELVYTDIPAEQFVHLAKSYPNYSATDANSTLLFKLQQQADALYPTVAKLRNNYAKYTSALAA